VGARTVRIEGYGPARPHEAYAARRQAAGQPPAPTIAVISNSLDLDFSSRLFTEALMPTVVVTAQVAPPERLAAASTAGEVVVAGDSKVDLSVALTELARRGHRRMLCEGGPHLLAQATEAGLLDELCLTLSPLLAAGTASRILTGATLTELAPLQLGHVLEEDGYLFLRYLLAR
jgi:riboflavin biosynthesis pyrimidine reductase